MVSRRRVEGTSRCALTVDPVPDRKPPSAALASDPQTVGADPAGLAWSAICCTIWHESITGHPLIYIIIIGGLYICCIVCAGIEQIHGKADVKPCKRFWCCDGIICMDGRKAVVNACIWLYCSRAKIKVLHPQQMQGKRKAPPAWAGWSCVNSKRFFLRFRVALNICIYIFLRSSLNNYIFYRIYRGTLCLIFL